MKILISYTATIDVDEGVEVSNSTIKKNLRDGGLKNIGMTECGDSLKWYELDPNFKW